MSKGTYEIIVWPKGTNTGDRFVNKSKILVDEITDCVARGLSFRLTFSTGAMMIYGAGEVSRIRITDLKEPVGL